MADYMQTLMARQRYMMAVREAQRRAAIQQSLAQHRAAQEAAQQQGLQQRALISGGNLARTDRRLDLMQADMESRDRERAARERAAAAKEQRQKELQDQKLKGQHAADLGKLRSVDESTRDVVERLNRILAAPNAAWGFDPNFGGYNAEWITQHLPVTRTQNTKKDLEALQSYFAMSGLQNLRGRTGQSVGAISEKEWPIIRSAYEALSPMVGEAAARQRLQGIKARALQMRNSELDLYNKEWGQSPFYQKQPFTTRPMETEGKARGVPKGVDPEAWDNMTPDEQGLWLGTTK